MSGTEDPKKVEPHGFLDWLKHYWQLVLGLFGLLSAGISILQANTATTTKVEDRLVHAENSLQHGEQRDTDNYAALNREINQLSQRLENRIQDTTSALATSLSDVAKHTDNRETEIYNTLSKNVVDLTARIDAEARMALDLRHLRDVEQGAIRERLAVLEAQVKFFGERLDVSNRTPPPAINPKGTRP